MEMDEGFSIGWDQEEPDDFEDDDVVSFKRRGIRLVYHKGKRVPRK